MCFCVCTGILMDNQTQQSWLFSSPPSLSLANVPNASSAHPSCREADDWLSRTAPHNNSLCMVTVTEERKLPNPPRYNLLKIAAIKNPRCLLHPVCVCVSLSSVCVWVGVCKHVYGVSERKRNMEKEGPGERKKGEYDREND